MADIVQIFLKLEQVAKFVSDSKKASGAVDDIGNKASKSGKKAASGWKSIAKWAGGAAVMYGAQRALRDVVSSTEDLAKSTLALQRQTNLDTQTASEWVGVLKERNISTRTFQVGLKTLSKQMENSRLGTGKQTAALSKLRHEYDAMQAMGGKKAPAALAKLQTKMDSVTAAGAKSRGMLATLGVSLDAIRHGNTGEVIKQVADGIAKLKNPAARTTAAVTLFGKSGTQLLPILMAGRKGIQEMLDTQKRYGNYLDGTGIKSTKQLIERQREMHAATDGLKIQLGEALLPVMLSISKILVTIARALAPITKNATAMKIAIGLLTLAFVAYQAAMVAASIATTIFDATAAPIALTVAAIVVAVALLAVGFIYLYRHSETFRKGVAALKGVAVDAFHAIVAAGKDVFDWVKKNWPLLLPILAGPFGLAALAIIKNWKQVKQLISDTFNLAKKAYDLMRHPVGAAKGLLHKATSLVPHQHGGVVGHKELSLVGEAGPEIVNLPAGSRITPLSVGGPAAAGGFGGDVVIPVYLDGREIARSVARVTADKLARR